MKDNSSSSWAKAWQITKTVWFNVLRTPTVIILSLLITVSVLYYGGKAVFKRYLAPVDVNDATPIEFVVESGWGVSTIAKHLYEACGEGEPGLITNKAVFKIYVDFMGKSKELQAGKYYLSKNMDVAAIMDTLCKGGESSKAVRVTIPEGTTVEGIADILIAAGMYIDRDEFLELCTTGEKFVNYSFVNNVVVAKEEERIYALEGYLFPDTYDFYKDASSEKVIDVLLKRFQDVCYNSESEYASRAEELGMSIDEVVSLASVIEREAVLSTDFFKVSAVFHVRIDKDMKLESDATLSYALKSDKLVFTSDELETDSHYNTYKYKGVPIGAICNPGTRAIEAALYPNEDFMDDEYLFFCLKDGATGELVYAKTLSEHNDNIAKYKKYW